MRRCYDYYYAKLNSKENELIFHWCGTDQISEAIAEFRRHFPKKRMRWLQIVWDTAIQHPEPEPTPSPEPEPEFNPFDEWWST